MSILQYFAKKQVGPLSNPEGTLFNARVHTKFHCFSNWHLIKVIMCEDLIIAKDAICENLCRFILFSWLILSATKIRYTVHMQSGPQPENSAGRFFWSKCGPFPTTAIQPTTVQEQLMSLYFMVCAQPTFMRVCKPID